MEVNKTKMIGKKGQTLAVGVVLSAMVVFIVGMVLYVVTAGVISGQTDTIPRTETGLAFNSTNNIVLSNLPVSAITSITNGTVTLTVTANYTLLNTRVNGTIVPGTKLVENASLYTVTYTSEPAGFVSDGTQRTIVLILPILFLVVIIMIVLGLVGVGLSRRE